MKKFYFVMMLLLGVSFMSEAQIRKASVIKPKAEAKKLASQGYNVLAGSLPMEQQLYEVYSKQLEKNDDGTKKYIIGQGTATAAVIQQAKIAARTAAKEELINQLQSTIKAIIEQNGGSTETGSKNNVSVQKTLNAVKDQCQQKMGLCPIVATFTKETKQGREVLVYVTYNYEEAKLMAIRAAESALTNESEELKKALNDPAYWE